jgi:hypothetical protein
MDNTFSIGKIILLLYVILSSTYCTDLFSESLKRSIKGNRMTQHIILLILIMVLLSMFGNQYICNITQSNEINLLIMSLVIYVWFIMTTKLDFAWFLSILIILTIYFLYENNLSIKNNEIMENNNIDDEKKKEIIDYYTNIQKYLLITIFGTTIVGNFFYMEKKQVQYGGGFSIEKFFI